MNQIVIVMFIIFMFASNALSDEQKKEKRLLLDKKDKISYSLGFQIGMDFKKEKMDLDDYALIKGLNDALLRTKPVLDQDEMNVTLSEMKKNIMTRQHAEKVEMIDQRLKGGRKVP